MNNFSGLKIGFAMTGSFCTFSRAFEQMKILREMGADIIPVISYAVLRTDTRFGTALSNFETITELCGRKPLCTIEETEPIGPKKMTDIMIVAPCTGNTLARLAESITDSPVTMAVKSHLRNSNPVVLNISTNDALAGSMKNIGFLMNTKNYYFVPFSQDDHEHKPSSLVADFTKLPETVLAALAGRQIQPVLI